MASKVPPPGGTLSLGNHAKCSMLASTCLPWSHSRFSLRFPFSRWRYSVESYRCSPHAGSRAGGSFPWAMPWPGESSSAWASPICYPKRRKCLPDLPTIPWVPCWRQGALRSFCGLTGCISNPWGRKRAASPENAASRCIPWSCWRRSRSTR